MNEFYLQLVGVSVSLNGQPVLNDIHLTIKKKEQWAITGASGSGKTVLAHTIAGNHFHSGEISSQFEKGKRIILVDQQHRFKDVTNQTNFYYQQRFNSFDAANTITVAESLAAVSGAADLQLLNSYTRMLNLNGLLNEPLIQLSNGENKRLQITRALMCSPAMLLLDQPFVGLDPTGRHELKKILGQLIEKGQQLILFTSNHEIPEFITHVGVLKDGDLITYTREDYISYYSNIPLPEINTGTVSRLFSPPPVSFSTAVKMVNVTVSYEQKQVLTNLNWQVRAGEQWSVSGPNGSGKSTLLSLITADNPQAYANEIYLFDKRRGSGESIWDIKQKIGFISPELHLYFDPAATAFQAVASGFFDTIGLFRPVNKNQETIVMDWMRYMGIAPLRNQWLSRLSLGQQRLVLLARALVKSPPMLILDEPCQGLDESQTSFFTQLVDIICKTFCTTLIYVSHYDSELPSCIDHFLKLPIVQDV